MGSGGHPPMEPDALPYGAWLVLERNGKHGKYSAWKCRCSSCGRVATVTSVTLLMARETWATACAACVVKRGRAKMDRTGQVFGTWQITHALDGDRFACKCARCGKLGEFHIRALRSANKRERSGCRACYWENMTDEQRANRWRKHEQTEAAE